MGGGVNKFDARNWLSQVHPKFENLSTSVENIIKSLLVKEGVDFLSVTSRTKSIDGCLEKIDRKSYQNPESRMTDISGVRVILFFESDIKKVSNILENAFRVDADNSLDQDSLLSANQMGYRSVHYVCDVGPMREELPEFEALAGLKFEVQIRTVLQHAWAELAHDRQYKFAGTLPRHLERKLYLYAGMLEVADKGFSELSADIDAYAQKVSIGTESGDLSFEINSVSVDEFVNGWANKSGYPLRKLSSGHDGINELLGEIRDFGVNSLDDLANTIPDNYTKIAKLHREHSTVLGLVRHWMMISDPERFLESVDPNWVIDASTVRILKEFLDDVEVDRLVEKIGVHDDYENDYEDDED